MKDEGGNMDKKDSGQSVSFGGPRMGGKNFTNFVQAVKDSKSRIFIEEAGDITEKHWQELQLKLRGIK